MEQIRSHRDLTVWNKAVDLTIDIYTLASKLPARENYGIYSQITRAACSVPANIAEGHGREGPREFVNFLSIARGSLAELDTFIEIGRRLGYFSDADVARPNELPAEVGKMTNGLRRSLTSR